MNKHDRLIRVDITGLSPFSLTFSVPDDRDDEEYIDEMLEGLLSETSRRFCEWDFAD